MQIQIITTREGLEEVVSQVMAESLSKFFNQSSPTTESQAKDYTIKQTQQELQISRTTLNNLLRTGQLKYYNIGRSIRITKASIENFKQVA